MTIFSFVDRRAASRLLFVMLVGFAPQGWADVFPFPSMGNLRSQLFPSQVSTAPHPSVVRVSAEERVGISNGSGTLVAVRGDYGLVVTNWHVVRDATGEISVAFPDGFRSAAKLLKSDKEWDLAALMILRPTATPVPIAPQPPRRGDTLTIAGYGKGDYRAATGRCLQYVSPGVSHPYEMIEVSVQARNGDSGGPIFNERGELAGVLFGAGSGTTSGSYSGRVRWFLESVWPNLDLDSRPEFASRPAEGTGLPAPPASVSNASLPITRPSYPRLVPVEDVPAVAENMLANSDSSDYSERYHPYREPIVSDPGPERPVPYYTAPPDRSPSGDAFASDEHAVGGSLPDLLKQVSPEHVKLLLAAIGCLAILSKVSKFLGGK